MFGWTSLARVVRGKFLSVRLRCLTVTAAKLAVAGEGVIIAKHLVPSFLS